MRQNKIQIYLAFAALLLSCISCSSDTISVPLKISQQDYLIIPAKYGQCQVNLLPLVGFCSNVLTAQYSNEPFVCGAHLIGENSFVGGRQFVAEFQLGNVQANLNFTNPNSTSSFYKERALCFGEKDFPNQDNVVEELFLQGLIKEQRFYIQINSTNASQDVIGSIDIGSPNFSLIKKGSKLVNLKHYSQNSAYSTPSDRSLKYGDIQLNYGTVIGFDLQSPFSQIGEFAINSIVGQLQKESIGYEYHFGAKSGDYIFNVDSIEKLQSISLNAIIQDGKPFTITIKPQNYTRKLQNGKYQVLLYPLQYSDFISLGYTILQSYYLGFDLPTQSYLISEKPEISIDQF
ncbi:hypothetical protein ABPG72_011039 [Tetrahymena utriculariae]